MSPLSPARASVQHLAPQSPALLAAKNPTSEWNTITEEKCDTTGLLAIGKVLSQSVLGLDQSIDHDIVPKIEPIDDEPALNSYYTLKVDVASEDDDSVGNYDDDDVDEHLTIDLSTKSRESPEVITTVCCNTPVINNNNNSINNNNNNINGDSGTDTSNKIVKGSAKRKKPNPMQIVLAKKSKIQEERVDNVDGVDENASTAVVVSTTAIDAPAAVIADDNGDNGKKNQTDSTIENEPVPVAVINRKNSIKSTDSHKSEQEKLDECMTEEILRSVLTDESEGDDMITEAFVKKKGCGKKTKKGRKDRKNGGNKKEMTGNSILYYKKQKKSIFH